MPRKLDVLHINTERTWRGGEQQTFSLVKGLHQQGLACGLVCQPDTVLAQKAKGSDLTVFEIGMHGEADFMSALQIRKILRERQCKLVHTHTSHALTLGFWASWGLKVKRLATRRVAFSIHRHDLLKINSIKYKHMTEHFVAISQNVKQALINDGLDRAKISVAYSGVDPLRFAGVTAAEVAVLRQELRLGADAKVIFNAAHLSGEKGHDILLRAMPIVLAKHPAAILVIAGGGDGSALWQMARDMNIADKVIFAGFRNDVGVFYHLCDVFVLPSLREGLGTAALDAMALQKPVVVSDAGGLPEIVANGVTGRMVPAGSVDDLAAALVTALDDKAPETKVWTENAYRHFLEHFTLEQMVTGNLAVYQKLLPDLF